MPDDHEAGPPRPRVSVVLPTYNRAHVVTAAIESVLAQTFSDLELLVVDDLSTDDTAAVVARVADPRVVYLRNARTKGVSGARNTGIFAARGEWLCQIDSDDIWEPTFLERLWRGMESAGEEVGVVYGTLAVVEDGRVVREHPASTSGFTYPRMLYEHFFFHVAAAFRASLLREVGGYDETLSVNEDTDLQLRVTARCAVLAVPEARYLYVSRPGERLMRDHAAAAASMRRYLEKHAALLAQHPLAKYRAVNAVLVAALKGRSWRLAGEMWLAMLPAALSMPRWFGRHQLQALRLAVDAVAGPRS